ncbi:MAG: efflux RND transporter periplasmic adaptor subunit, partial [Bacteroidales bacterium]
KGKITNVVTATGTIQAITTVNVGTQVSGIIQHIYVDFNDHVKKGEILAKLDTTALAAQVDQSQASVNQAQAQYDFQKYTFDREKTLYDKKLVAEADYDQALYNYENAKAALDNAKSALSRAKVNLEYATIYSPIDGVVLNRAVEAGQTVASSFSTPTLFTIVNDLNEMEVQTSVDEADIGKVKDGQKVDFTVDAYPDMEFQGVVSQVRLQPIVTNNVVTYNVILRAPNPGQRLMPGMTASATIIVQEKDSALIVSGRALRFRPDQNFLKKMTAMNPPKSEGANKAQGSSQVAGGPRSDFSRGAQSFGNGLLPTAENADLAPKAVWIETDSDKIKRVPVNVGIDNGTDVEILSGLKEGDKVVVAMTDSKEKADKQQTNQRRPFLL